MLCLFVWSKETGEMMIYSQNSKEERFNRTDKLIDHLRKLEQLRQSEQVKRPTTKWEFYQSHQVVVKFYPTHTPLLGYLEELPQYITHREDGTKTKYIIPLTGFKDHLCFFRCWALHNGSTSEKNPLTSKAKELQQKWFHLTGCKAITEDNFEVFEELFQISVMVYEKGAEGKAWELRRRGAQGNKNSMSIGIHDAHCYYIRDINKVTKSFVCQQCQQVFNKVCNLYRHICTNGETDIEFSKSKLKVTHSKFQQTFGVRRDTIPYPYFICFDIESLQRKSERKPKKLENGEDMKTTIDCEHIPVSVSIADNLSNTQKTIISEDPNELVDLMFNEMSSRRESILLKVRNEFSKYLTGEQLCRATTELLTGCKFNKQKPKWLEGLELDCYNKELKLAVEYNGIQHYQHTEFFHKTLEEFEKQQERDALKARLCKQNDINLIIISYKDDMMIELRKKLQLKTNECRMSKDVICDHAFKNDSKLKDYINQVPVIGFNTSKYDINVLKTYIVSRFTEANIANSNGRFMFITTDQFRFIDAYNYLSPNYSLDKWLKAYGCQMSKSFFPYEWFDSYDKLNYKGLPPIDCWYSRLKQKHISQEDYKNCLAIFKQKDMIYFREWLEYYNSMDVLPMLEATSKMVNVYLKDGIDILNRYRRRRY